MMFNISQLGWVEKKVLKILYFNMDSGPYSTREIADGLRMSRNKTYGALEALFKRKEKNYIIKWKRGNERLWAVNPKNVRLIRQELGIRRPEEDSEQEENEIETAIKITKPIIEAGLRTLAASSPVGLQVYCAFKIADAAYESWNLIMKSQEAYQREGIAGPIKMLGKTVATETVGGMQTNMIWSAVETKIQPEYKDVSKKILSGAIDEITDREVDAVERFLEQNI